MQTSTLTSAKIKQAKLKQCSTSLPGGNLVDGLPPVPSIVNVFDVKLSLFEHCKNLLTCAVKSISEGPDPAHHRGLKIAKTCMAVH